MNYHKFITQKITSWQELEKNIESLSTTKERGDVFEQFVFLYLTLKKNLYQITELYREKDVPLKYRQKFKLEKTDCGVDGLIILNNGKSAAYQAKFRTNREKPSYAELSKFWIEAKLTDYHYTIANCYYLSKLAKKHRKHLSILIDEFEKLDKLFFLEFYELANKKPKIHKQFYTPDQFQQRIINNTLKGFRNNNRGKIIAACGTGKTLTSLWITELMKTKKVLFLTPSLALIKQTLEAWSDQTKIPFSYLCVCSDKSVSSEMDEGDLDISEVNIPVTTSPDLIVPYLSTNNDAKQIIFSTYQSLDVLATAMNKVRNFNFDLIIFDEAHRTAGAKDSGLFSLALYDQHIKSKKRLFMTATERLVKPWIIRKAKEANRIVFSMDDEQLYGPVFDRFNFGEAIKGKIISDYRIIVAGVKEKEIYQWIENNDYLVEVENRSEEYYTTAQNIFRQIMLIKAMKEFSIKKAITFHSTVKNAQEFIASSKRDDLNLLRIISKIWPEKEKRVYLDHINGSMSAGERKERLDLFKDANFGVISNARCLTEGIDVPIIDSVYFVNPKNSLIDIIQACGRALRKPRDKHDKIAYFIVPILIPEGSSEADAINEIDFEMLHNLIQSLRDQDIRLAEWIDKINISASKGKPSQFTKYSETPIVFQLPAKFDVRKFEEKLYLRIAEVNADPTKFGYKTKTYGKTERRSSYKRIFKTLGDYSVESYKKNLVIPTIEKFKSKDQAVSMNEIKINHNNVSHTERLGLIISEDKKFKLTPLGIQLFEKKLTFEQIFKGQMLRYYSAVKEKEGKRILFPYRACLKILLDVKSINYVEFVFGLYSMVDYSKESIAEAIEGIRFIREKYPNIEILNEKNKAKVLDELNGHFGTNFNITDIWEKKTTINNQFIYFRNHLSLFYHAIKCDKKGVYLKKNGKSKIVSLLMKGQAFENESDEEKLKNGYIKNIVIFMLLRI